MMGLDHWHGWLLALWQKCRLPLYQIQQWPVTRKEWINASFPGSFEARYWADRFLLADILLKQYPTKT